MDFLKRFFGPIIKAGAFAIARHAATAGGAALLTWLLSHHVDADMAARLVGDLQDAILTMTGAGLVAVGVHATVKDVRQVDAKVTVAAAAGVSEGHALAQAQQDGAAAQRTADQSLADAVAKAIATADKAKPADKAAVLGSIKSGAF